jgi:hypothetical protein
MNESRYLTVEEALRRIQTLKKDVEYVGSLEEKWRDQQKRFPIIYDGIRKQAEAFRLRVDQLKTLKVETTVEELDRLREAAVSGKSFKGLLGGVVENNGKPLEEHGGAEG